MYGKDRKREIIGHYPDLGLKEARDQAKRLMVDRNTPNPISVPKPFLEAVAGFLEANKARIKPSTHEQYGYYLRKMAFQKNVGELTKADVNAGLAHWQAKAWAQNYAHSALRVFLNWCLDQGIIATHPLIRSKEPNKVKSRDRVLSDEELGRIWRCTTDTPYGRILRVLILTGQRRMEVGNLKPEDVQDGTITFHTKGDRINVLPLTPLVKENLLLPFRFNNWGDAKANFDTDCGVDFRHHDLRRTLATKLAGMGTPIIVIERILGHSYGGRVFQTYQRHSYLDEMREALLKYESHILSIARA
jgi:integrase